MPQPFHLAIPVHDLEQARKFYGQLLGFEEGRSSEHWVDYDCYRPQLVVHLDVSMKPKAANTSQVDGHGVPIPHFGVVLDMASWRKLANRLKNEQVKFVIEPYIRFEGKPGEQATMFFNDPSGNALEFKGFENMDDLFKG